MAGKNCFIDKSRPCDLTCKAAFPVDDAVDPVDCYFVWLASHLGDSAFDFRRMMEAVIADAEGQVRQLELHVSAENAAACAAYAALGFLEVGRVPEALQHDGRFVEELLMVRRTTG